MSTILNVDFDELINQNFRLGVQPIIAWRQYHVWAIFTHYYITTIPLWQHYVSDWLCLRQQEFVSLNGHCWGCWLWLWFKWYIMTCYIDWVLIITDSDLVDYQSQITGRVGLFVQYIPQDMVLLCFCFVVVILSLLNGGMSEVYPYHSWKPNWGNHIAGLLQERHSSSALAMELHLALSHRYACLSASEVILKHITLCQTTNKHNKVWIMCIFHGMYCIPVIKSIMKMILFLCFKASLLWKKCIGITYDE